MTTAATTNTNGCSNETSMPKAKRPHSRVATRLHRPIVAIDTVAGTMIRLNGVGEATSSSSVPSRRSRCRVDDAVVLTADHTPMTLAPTAALTSAASSPFCRYMRNTVVAKNSG